MRQIGIGDSHWFGFVCVRRESINHCLEMLSGKGFEIDIGFLIEHKNYIVFAINEGYCSTNRYIESFVV